MKFFMKAVRILLIDDHALVRASLRVILQKMPGVQIIGEAGTGWLGIKLSRSLKPDLVILDLKLPDISGLEVTLRLLKLDPSIKILILTAETHELTSTWVFSAGAHGFLSKAASAEDFRQALTNILEGRPAEQKNFLSEKNSVFGQLSAREVEIMRMILRGETTLGIAQQLYLDAQTIYAYRSHIFKKLQVKNAVSLAILALRHGLAPEDPKFE